MVAPGQKTNVPSKYYSHVKKNNHGVIFLRSRDFIRILLNKLFLPLSPTFDDNGPKKLLYMNFQRSEMLLGKGLA